MRTFNWVTIGAAVVITAAEAMMFNHETVAASDTGSLSTATGLPSSATASNPQWLRREVESSFPHGKTYEPEPANP
jgi:hypothetical protein